MAKQQFIPDRKGKGTGYAGGEHGKGRLFRRGLTWWIQYYVRGQRVRESSGSRKQAVAEKLLMRRLVALEDGTLERSRKPVPYGDMRARLVARWMLDLDRKRKDCDYLLARLDEFFSGETSATITDDKVDEFKLARRRAGASNATINRALDALRQMLTLGMRNPPAVKKLPEPPARQGFLTEEEYLRLWAALPESLRPLAAFAYHTGMRLGELKNLMWKNVNLTDGIIRLEAEQTKTGEGRAIPFGELPELAQIMARLWGSAKDRAGLVFTRANGKPLIATRKAFVRACIKAGLGRMCWRCPTCHVQVEVGKQPRAPENPPAPAPTCRCGETCCWHYTGRMFHDFRRTGVRNLRRAGVPESVAMKISGHKTRSVFDRYDIKDTRDVAEAMERLNRFHEDEDRRPRPGTRPS